MLVGLTRQKGNVIAFLLPLLAVGSLCAYLFHIISDYVPAGGPVPYIFVSLFIFPIAVIWPLLKDVTELQELDSITSTERTRLSGMISEIQRYLKACAFILLFFGITTGITLYLIVVNVIDANLALSGIGFFVGCSITIFIFLFNMRVKLQNYKAKLSSRIKELRQARKLLKRTQRKDI